MSSLHAFLTQINLFRGRSLSDSHELAMFLQLFNGHPWRRDTGRALIQYVDYGTILYSLFINSEWGC